MEFVFEVIFQVVGEIVLQIVFELLAELGIKSLEHTWKKPRSVVLSIVGFILLGVLAGAVSLTIFPGAIILNPDIRMANLFVTPVLAGLAMMLVGKLRERKGQSLVSLDRFGFAFVFAFAMAWTRYLWAS